MKTLFLRVKELNNLTQFWLYSWIQEGDSWYDRKQHLITPVRTKQIERVSFKLRGETQAMRLDVFEMFLFPSVCLDLENY